MLSSASVVRGLRASSSRFQTKRFASHEAPQYNEPSGWLFGEKVPAFLFNGCCDDSFHTSCSHHRQDRSEWKRTGRMYGIWECSVPWHSPAWCSTTNPTPGEFLIIYWVIICSIHYHLVCKRGHSRRLKNGWRRVARNTSTSRRHHQHQHDFHSTTIYECTLNVFTAWAFPHGRNHFSTRHAPLANRVNPYSSWLFL